jgi:hypothetical protein
MIHSLLALMLVVSPGHDHTPQIRRDLHGYHSSAHRQPFVVRKKHTSK